MMVASMLQVIRWLEADGIDAIHLASGGGIPGIRPRPARAVSIGRLVRSAVRIPVLRNDLFPTTAAILAAINDASCDAVSLEQPGLQLKQAG
jgi:2,4-dienoyl-CoA reductase-like NADH-dependent reductase (Old Yellow Enzyme family)